MKSLEWVENFLAQPIAFVFVSVDPDFIINQIEDPIIKAKIDNYAEAKTLILTNSPANEDIQQQAEILYGLIHAKYINTKEGMEKMVEKQRNKEFPHCPRIFCNHTTCVPYGITDELKDKTIKMFCPNCHEFYNVADEKIAKIDGAYFGPDWVNQLCQVHSELELAEKTEYTPRIFGFRVYQQADSAQEDKPLSE